MGPWLWLTLGWWQAKREYYDELLCRCPMFAQLEAYERHFVADGLQPIIAEAGEMIFAEGDSGDRFYIVEEGEVVMSKGEENREVARVGVGQ